MWTDDVQKIAVMWMTHTKNSFFFNYNFIKTVHTVIQRAVDNKCGDPTQKEGWICIQKSDPINYSHV